MKFRILNLRLISILASEAHFYNINSQNVLRACSETLERFLEEGNEFSELTRQGNNNTLLTSSN